MDTTQKTLPLEFAPYTQGCQEDDFVSYPHRVLALLADRRVGDASAQEQLTALNDIAFERQSTDKDFEAELTEYPQQLRALFAERSMFKDHLTYAFFLPAHLPEAEDGCYQLIAEITAGNEERMIDALIEQGARMQKNLMHIPAYESKHQLHAGKRLSLRSGNACLHYVPHYSAGDHYVQEYHHRVRLFLTPTVADELMQQAANNCKRQGAQRSDFVAIKDPLGKSKNGWKVSLIRDSQARAQRNKRRAPTRWAHKTKQTLGMESASLFNNLSSRPASKREIAALDYTWWSEEQCYVPTRAFREYRQTLSALAELGAYNQAMHVSWRSHSPHVPAPDRAGRANWDHMIEALASELSLEDDLSAETQSYLLQGNLPPDQHQVSAGKQEAYRAQVPHKAPTSERGVLKIAADSIHEAIALMDRVGALGRLLPEIPADLIYQGRRRQGRIHPGELSYQSGRTKTPHLAGRMVLHGLTGCREENVIQRFDMLVATGGLRSTSERRHTGIRVITLSPKGDIASGIDMGVATNIGYTTPLGGFLVFAMRPEVLARRDVFFAPVDFGGGQNRYERFQEYAKSIGQEGMYHPPSPECRLHHYTHGTEHVKNETYFRHEIAWEEVDTLYVDMRFDFAASIFKRVERYKAQGKLPAQLCVAGYTGRESLPALIKARSAAIEAGTPASDSDQAAEDFLFGPSNDNAENAVQTTGQKATHPPIPFSDSPLPLLEGSIEALMYDDKNLAAKLSVNYSAEMKLGAKYAFNSKKLGAKYSYGSEKLGVEYPPGSVKPTTKYPSSSVKLGAKYPYSDEKLGAKYSYGDGKPKPPTKESSSSKQPKAAKSIKPIKPVKPIKPSKPVKPTKPTKPLPQNPWDFDDLDSSSF